MPPTHEPPPGPQASSHPHTLPAEVELCVVNALSRPVHVPRATYRVQVFKDFPFSSIEQLAAYYDKLGISDMYLSPVTQARSGSNHGYDVVDQNRLNEEAGGEEAFQKMCAALDARGMGLLLDIVPNHMGVGPASPWWQDVLANGQASRYAEYFDIDWKPLRADMQNRLLLPVLGNSYGEELESGNLRLIFDDGQFHVAYFETTLPVSLPSLVTVLAKHAGVGTAELSSAISALAKVPRHSTPDPELRAQRQSQLETLQPQVQAALADPANRSVVDAAMRGLTGTQGDAASFDALHTLLDAQPYRLANWRTSGDDINYRRFFDVNDLVGLRMENPIVFAATHKLIRRLLAQGTVKGLRIDHCDGLFDPRQYLIRLQKLGAAATCAGPEAAGELAANGIEQQLRALLRGIPWGPEHTAVYTLVEKILEPRETLPSSWPVHGSSGYDFIFEVNNLFIDSSAEKHFTGTYERFAPQIQPPVELIYDKKLMIMNTALSSEVAVLTNLLSQMAMADRKARDFTLKVLATVIRGAIASFPVYRTYIDDRGRYTDQDKIYIRYAISSAKLRNPAISAQAFDFLRDTLLLNDRESAGDNETGRNQLYFALKFQQLCGPVMAKGVEDTTFYVYNRFVSCNEVGGSLRSFGISTEDFHAATQARLKDSPYSMVASSTHDTKRSEDFRARLNVLSEMPREWRKAVLRWQRQNALHKTKLEDGRTAPDGNEEYFLYQTIVGTLPWEISDDKCREQYVARVKDYMHKALAEAKVNLSWVNPDPKYVAAADKFLDGILAADAFFLREVRNFLPPVELFGAVNSLSQQLLKLTVPGVPDLYQGTELWEFSMVDPDNRRPVDYALRAQMLDDLRTTVIPTEAQRSGGTRCFSKLCAELLADYKSGRVKLWLTHRALECRRDQPALFRDGDYQPCAVDGATENIVAFTRTHAEKSIAVIAPRFTYKLMPGEINFPIGRAWGESAVTLPAGTWNCKLSGLSFESTGKPTLLADILSAFPAALLVRE